MISQADIPKIIGRAKLDLKLAQTVRTGLLCGLIYGLVLGPRIGEHTFSGLILLAVCLSWVLLGVRSRRKAALTATASQLLAAGQIEQAGHILAQTFRGYCLHKPVILMICHNLAVILQKRHLWLPAWQLCELVRSQGSKRYSELTVASESVRADCSLALNNLPAAYESLLTLSRMPLSVAERLGVLLAEITYGIRSGRCQEIMADLRNKVTLAGLMPTEQAGVAHGWLALAAEVAGQADRRNWLWRRCLLYKTADELLEVQPGLKRVADAISTDDMKACTTDDGQIKF